MQVSQQDLTEYLAIDGIERIKRCVASDGYAELWDKSSRDTRIMMMDGVQRARELGLPWAELDKHTRMAIATRVHGHYDFAAQVGLDAQSPNAKTG